MKIIPVDKNALLNDLSAMCIDDYDYEVYSEVFDMIDQAPVLDYAPVVHAHWEVISTHNGCTLDYDCICSNCHMSGAEDKFCRYCGAVMDLPEEYREER